MRKSPLSRTPQKSRTISRSRMTEGSSTQRATSNLYYCHYKNAIYMGGIKAFKKDGRGILLHDSGLSVLASYYNDLMHGHNIFFDNYSLLSAIFSKNKVIEAVFRTQGFLVFLNYNQEQELEGKIKLLNFLAKTIIYATFKKGAMVDKVEQTDRNLLGRIFDSGEYELLIGRTHAKVVNYEFEKIPNIEAEKHGNKVIVGFEKNGFINGLGFQFIFRGSQGGYNPDTHRQEDEFELKVVERGYYINTQLNGMGQKVFKNGNFYIGDFKNGIFEGNGILKNSEKKNWVSGYFKDGNLVELLEYSSDNSSRGVSRIIEALHERKTNWINNEVHLQDLSFFLEEIEKIITTVPNKQTRTLEQRKLDVLRRIQEKFIADTDEYPTEQMENSINQLRNSHLENSSAVKYSFGQLGQNQNVSSSRVNSDSYRVNEGKNYEVSRSPKQQKKDSSMTPHKKVNLSKTQMRPFQQPHSPEFIKVNDNLFSSRKTDNVSSGEVQKWKVQKLQFDQSRNSGSGYMDPLSSERYSVNSRSNLDSKRMITKNKIFKYLQTQEERGSPQFSYKKTDTLRQMQRER